MTPRLATITACLFSAILVASQVIGGSVYFINYQHNGAGTSSFVRSGNTWNQMDGTFLGSLTAAGNELTLLDSTGTDNGLDLKVTTEVGNLPNNVSASVFPSTADLPWFDPSGSGDTLARGVRMLKLRNSAEREYTITGFNAGDSVTVQWVAADNHAGTTRMADFTVNDLFANVISGNAVDSMSFAANRANGKTQTDNDGGILGTNSYMEWSGVLPSNGEVAFRARSTGDRNVTIGSAIRIEVTAAIPEPSTLILAALGLIGLLGWRRRRR